MPKNSLFKISLKKFRRNLEAVINENLLRKTEDLRDAGTQIFVEQARENLLRDNTGTPESQAMIQQIAESIEVDTSTRTLNRFGSIASKPRQVTGSVVRIPIDKEGLVLFLEYGTGPQGKAGAIQTGFLSEARKIHWAYEIHKDNYKQLRDRFNKSFGEKGFFFKYGKYKYIDQNDSILSEKVSSVQWVKGYTKKTKTGNIVSVRPYQKKASRIKVFQYKRPWVFSTGIKPVRYIYRAKKAVVPLLNKRLKGD